MTLGEKLKAFRKSSKLSLKSLSEKTDVSISFLSDIENNRSNPSIDNLKLIAKALNTSVSYFIDDSAESIFDGIIDDGELLQVINLLNNFKEWNTEDKLELLYYLKAKKVIRSNE